jgi:hypothetical protein
MVGTPLMLAPFVAEYPQWRKLVSSSVMEPTELYFMVCDVCGGGIESSGRRSGEPKVTKLRIAEENGISRLARDQRRIGKGSQQDVRPVR